mgnify:CR=1 FL=1
MWHPAWKIPARTPSVGPCPHCDATNLQPCSADLPGGIGPGERPDGFGAVGLKAGGRPWLCGELLALPRAPSLLLDGELP